MIRLNVAGAERSFSQQQVVMGRGSNCDLRFDAERDLEVSGRHAELNARDGALFLRDLGSTNGTFLNGARLLSERNVNPGDRIRLGQHGPTIEVLRNAGQVTQRVEAAVARRTKSLTVGFVFIGLIVIAVICAVGYVVIKQKQEPLGPTAANNSNIDYSAINHASGAGVVLIAVQMPNGSKFTGTGFNVDSAGLIFTNRHLVRSEDGSKAARILVIFANTNLWLPAKTIWMSDSADVAALRIDPSPKRYPTVTSVAPSNGKLDVGSPVAISGFPLGIATPMEGTGVDITARSTLGAGIVGKILPNLIQVDGYATDGSSGSPLLNRDGHVVGIVYGGMRESGGQIVLALPSEFFIAKIPELRATALQKAAE